MDNLPDFKFQTNKLGLGDYIKLEEFVKELISSISEKNENYEVCDFSRDFIISKLSKQMSDCLVLKHLVETVLEKGPTMKHVTIRTLEITHARKKIRLAINFAFKPCETHKRDVSSLANVEAMMDEMIFDILKCDPSLCKKVSGTPYFLCETLMDTSIFDSLFN